MVSCHSLCALVLSIFIPPLGVFIMRGCGKDFWLNLLLTLLIFFPGMIHAIWICARTAPPSRDALPA